jgi:16S rRNA (adenine1518-N6/adenine1519-N6)-dimethyltransferase
MRVKKYLGQNFLFDPSILKKIIGAAQINPEDTVVEIGAGYGSLTILLAEVSRKVIAIEFDNDIFNELLEKTRFIRTIEAVNCDALSYPYEKLEGFKVVANIPYYITTPIIFRLLESKKNLQSITLTIQKEVAERIVAKPCGKDYGALSLSVQFYTEPEIKFIIPAGAFRPVPKVDSAVVHMKVLRTPRMVVPDERLFFKLVKTGFSQRRKTIHNALKALDADIKEVLGKAGIETTRRAETLSMEDFGRLCEELHKKKGLRLDSGSP